LHSARICGHAGAFPRQKSVCASRKFFVAVPSPNAATAKRLHSLQNAALLDPVAAAADALFSLARALGQGNDENLTDNGLGGPMTDILPSVFSPAGGSSIPPQTSAGLPFTSFSRHELNAIFSLYGAQVAAGEWRDYSIDFLKDKAVFSIFRRSTERPLYRIEKNPKLTKRQGAYSVVAMTGLILKRGHDLAKVLRVLDRKLSVVNA
jgi:hypothetical protein